MALHARPMARAPVSTVIRSSRSGGSRPRSLNHVPTLVDPVAGTAVAETHDGVEWVGAAVVLRPASLGKPPPPAKIASVRPTRGR